ncbi:MAG: bacillithiol system redox-active protein YtxJ [Acidobacteria bacterium]|nr:bacillithiol system redox-active protein YtxJ [Acidobacteriota bacterium]
MSNNLQELHSLQDLQQVLEDSTHRPVLIFKHSNSCPISGRGFKQFQAYLENADPRASYHLITVQNARPLSNEVAQRLGVRHETPQAILVRDGREIWNASHFEITVEALQTAIKQASQ